MRDQAAVGVDSFLDIGQVTVLDDRACTVSESGLTCWNTVTGHGFLLSRTRYLNW